MQYIIKYTDDTDAFKEYEQKVNDFTEEVKAQLAKLITDDYICKKQYPIGSIYINAIDIRDPREILGCGVWKRINAGAYLINEGLTNINKGNYSGYSVVSLTSGLSTFISSIQSNQYLKMGLPNITGRTACIVADGSSGGSGSLRVEGGCRGRGWKGQDGNDIRTIAFYASSSNTIYGTGNAVIPYSYSVMMWERID